MEPYILFLLFVKHWYVDFVNQTNAEVQGKGIYLNQLGLYHSFKHGLLTMVILLLDNNINQAIILGSVDFMVHYHVDYLKMRFGNRDITNPKFWHHLGFDQLMHYITYLLIVYV